MKRAFETRRGFGLVYELNDLYGWVGTLLLGGCPTANYRKGVCVLFSVRNIGYEKCVPRWLEVSGAICFHVGGWIRARA